MDISSLRTDYKKHSLLEAEMAQSPFKQFETWFDEVLKSECLEPNAMHLSTVNASGQPSGRIVLLKEIDEGFCFYTNYQSRKGKELAESNNLAAITFFWPELERQVRIEGRVELVDVQKAELYFASRPKLSQIGAWASQQSSLLPNRAVLEDNFAKIETEYKKAILPKPDFWGGYRLLPNYFEFWQGRRSRLHDRLVYNWQNNSWALSRLAP
jgi:pyridoxamine 5'-phosphate oxidase